MRFTWAWIAFAAVLAAQDLASLSQQAQTLLNSDPAKAAEIYRTVLAQRPDWAEGWMYLGAALYNTERNAESLDAFRKGTSLAPSLGAAWGFTGLAEYRLHRDQAALADIQKGEALGLGPNHQFESAVRQTAAYLLIPQSRFDDALGQLQPLANFEDHSPGIITAAGMCALAIPKLPSSLTPLERSLVALAGKGQWNAISRRPAEAEAAFRELLTRFPNERGVHYAYGLFLMESDQKAALDQFRLETAAHPDLWTAWTLSATLETKNGAPETALIDIEHARKVTPPSFAWLCDAEAGRAHMTLGDETRAIVELRSALKLQPGSPQLHHLLAQAYRRSGRTEEAARESAEFERLKTQSDPFAMPH